MDGDINLKKVTIFISFIGVLILSCSSKKGVFTDELTFEILNKNVKDGEKLKVKLINNTNKDYCLVLDTTSLLKPISFFSPSGYFRDALTFLVDSDNIQISQEVVDYDCFPLDTKYFEEQNKIFNKRTVKSLLRIKSHSSVVFYVPFKIKTIINQECWYGNDKLNDKKEYSVEFKYFGKYKSVLTSKMRDSIKGMGYEIYEKTITSNRTPLILKK